MRSGLAKAASAWLWCVPTALAIAPAAALAQGAVTTYGTSIGVDMARKAAAAAIDEGRKNGWTVAVAVVDTAGALVYFERIDGTQTGSSRVAREKAESSVAFKRPTKAFEDALAGGRMGILALSGAVPLEGGLPLVTGGKIIGGIGVSGATSPQDGVCARAGAEAIGAAPPAPAAGAGTTSPGGSAGSGGATGGSAAGTGSTAAGGSSGSGGTSGSPGPSTPGSSGSAAQPGKAPPSGRK